ncbi:MAG: PD-(D/E)XK nuclease family protein [Acidobacteria bacterium]|nr:PD-(D/E)XK nuclease family protein [Acidobacteriota bacterium]
MPGPSSTCIPSSPRTPLRVVESASAAWRLAGAREFVSSFPTGNELLLVGASRGAIDDFARSIARARGATFGLHRFSFTQLAARLAATRLAAQGIAPSTLLGTEAVAARAIFDADRSGELAYFESIGRMPGFPKALGRTLAELRLAGVAPRALQFAGASGADLAILLERFESQFVSASAGDRRALFDAASSVTAAGGTAWSGLPLLLLDVPIESAAEERFIAALVAQSPHALATLAFGDELARARFEMLGGVIERDLESSETDDLARLRRYLFADDTPPFRRQGKELEFFSAPGEGRETVEIARRIIREARRGARLDEIAIFVRAPQGYHGLLEHALERAGIGAYFDRGTRRPDPSGRAFLALLRCAAERASANRFAEYLSLGQVPSLSTFNRSGAEQAPRTWVAPADEVFGTLADEPRSPDEEGDVRDASPRPDSDEDAVVAGTLRAPWKWERLLVESAVIGGHERWRRRLDGLAAEYRLRLQELAAEEPESPRIASLARDSRNLRHLREFALPIIDELSRWPERATWRDWLDRFETLAPRVLRRPGHVLRVFADLRPMGDIGPVALDEACEVLADRLLTLERDPPARRYGRVFIGSPHQARGRTFKVVFVPGLAERMFPQKPREDAILLDAARNMLGARLPTKDDRRITERLLLRLAIGSATERLYLSYPRIELTESRPRVPSFYALDVVRAVTGRVPDHEALISETAAEGDAALAWPAPTRPELAIDDFEHDLSVLGHLLRSRDPDAVRGHAQYLLQLNECLRRSVISRWARGAVGWSEHDGLIKHTPHTREILEGERLGARPYSLSALQRFSICPYQFFLSAIHRLEPAEEPAPLQRMDPLTRGGIFHRIQARFFRASTAAGFVPVDHANLDHVLALLDQTVERVAAEYHEDLAPAIERVWNDEVTGLRNDLRSWVRLLPADPGWVPWLFEFAFGLDADGEHDPRSREAPVVIDGRYHLRGSVDLVERRADGAALRITDHKTGKVWSTHKTIVGGGGVLQPVLYAAAVEQALASPVTSGRLFYCTAAGGFVSHEIPLNETTRRLGIEALEIVDRSIERGFLAAAPRERACRRCDFRPVCGPDEEARVRRKAADRLADLEALRSRP